MFSQHFLTKQRRERLVFLHEWLTHDKSQFCSKLHTDRTYSTRVIRHCLCLSLFSSLLTSMENTATIFAQFADFCRFFNTILSCWRVITVRANFLKFISISGAGWLAASFDRFVLALGPWFQHAHAQYAHYAHATVPLIGCGEWIEMKKSEIDRDTLRRQQTERFHFCTTSLIKIP